MDAVEKLKIARRNLVCNMGMSYHDYVGTMKKWFSGKINKEQLNNELQSYLTQAQIRCHNEFIQALLLKSTDAHFMIPNSSRSRSNYSAKKKETEEQLNVNPEIFQEELSYKAVNSRFLPDDITIYGHFVLSTWGNEVDDIDDEACKLVVAASKRFMKNILSAVISRRNGFKVHRGKFIYNYGMPMANPWLRNTANYDCQADYSTKVYKTEEGFHVKTIDHKKFEQDIIFQLSATSPENHVTRKSPISIDDLIDTLKIHKHIIASSTMYSLFMEKLLMSRYHPSQDELEAEKDIRENRFIC